MTPTEKKIISGIFAFLAVLAGVVIYFFDTVLYP